MAFFFPFKAKAVAIARTELPSAPPLVKLNIEGVPTSSGWAPKVGLVSTHPVSIESLATPSVGGDLLGSLGAALKGRGTDAGAIPTELARLSAVEARTLSLTAQVRDRPAVADRDDTRSQRQKRSLSVG